MDPLPASELLQFVANSFAQRVALSVRARVVDKSVFDGTAVVNPFSYGVARPTVHTDALGLEVFLFGRHPTILRPGPWRLPPGQVSRSCRPPRPTPVHPYEPPLLRPGPRKPPPWWWHLFRLVLKLGDALDDTFGGNQFIVPVGGGKSREQRSSPECRCERSGEPISWEGLYL